MHNFNCSIDLALTYAIRRPQLALSLAREALCFALVMQRPDLVYRANELLATIA